MRQPRPGLRRRAHAAHRRPRTRLCQASGAEHGGAGGPRSTGRAGIANPDRPVAQVVPRGRHRSAQSGRSRLADGRRGHGRHPGRRPHHPCPRGREDDPRGPDGRRYPASAPTIGSFRAMDFLTELFRRPAITWWDLLDILIVSILVYELLKLIRGTRAVQLAIGIAAIVGLYYLSTGLQLETLNWLIRNIIGYVVFAAIVLLQADIRRALVHLGRGRLFRRLEGKNTDDETVEELVVATTTLSAKKTGAIIVIERAIGLRNYIESGITLDAQLTYDLLVSIFQPTSPLHDGAVIVQGDRIAAAACFLPLTINPRLNRELGSRHRAAIGVTEENDSVAIVVSEETGKISGVEDGDIEHDIDSERLRTRIKSVVTQRRTRGKQRQAGYSFG